MSKDKVIILLLLLLLLTNILAGIGKWKRETTAIETGIMEIKGQKYHLIPWEKDAP